MKVSNCTLTMPLISILDFAWKLGFRLYDWQARILLRYEAGDRTAVAACNFSGKASLLELGHEEIWDQAAGMHYGGDGRAASSQQGKDGYHPG